MDISFEQIPQFVINLDRRPDRWSVTYRNLTRNGFTGIQRFSAIDAKKISDTELTTILTPSAFEQISKPVRTEHWHLSRGAVGCFLSHATLWKQLLDSDAPAYLIFEDDARSVITADKMKRLLQDAPKDWDILLFGWIVPERRPILPAESDENPVTFFSRHWIQLLGFWGLHGYMITRTCAQKVLSRLFPISAQIDSWLSDLALSGLIKIYAANPPVIFQNVSINSTDIQTPIFLADIGKTIAKVSNKDITPSSQPTGTATTIRLENKAHSSILYEISCVFLTTFCLLMTLSYFRVRDTELVTLFVFVLLLLFWIVFNIISEDYNKARIVSINSPDVKDV